jgi:hypothetical protein
MTGPVPHGPKKEGARFREIGYNLQTLPKSEAIRCRLPKDLRELWLQFFEYVYWQRD